MVVNLPHLDIQGGLGGTCNSNIGYNKRCGENHGRRRYFVNQDRSVVTRSHHWPGIQLIKNSANVMHNGWIDSKINLLPPYC